MLIIKILVVLIPILLAFTEKKGRGRWYLSAIVLLFILSLWNEINENTAKKRDDQEKANLHIARTLDSNRINSLLKYDTAITKSNNSLKDKADSLLTSNYEIQRKLNAIQLALANNNYKYDPIKGMIIPKNAPLAKEGSRLIDNTKIVNNLTSSRHYQEKISNFQKQAEQYMPILKKDSADLKYVADRHWYKFRNDEKIATDIETARLKLYKDNILFKVVNDSIFYYQTKLKAVSSN